MIGASNHENAIVALQTVHFVQKIAANVVGDNGIKVFKDEIAWRELSRLCENESNASLWSHVLFFFECPRQPDSLYTQLDHSQRNN